MENKFKEGQWLIRRWSDENGGEVDLCKFSSTFSNTEFYYSRFYRFEGDYLMWIETGRNNMPIEYFDLRMDFNWRVASKDELAKYSKMFFN